MMQSLKFLALVAAVASLSACDKSSSGGPTLASSGGGACTPFKGVDAAAPPPGSPSDGSAAVQECLHRWGYALAQSKETADVVAAATVTACGGPIATWNQQSLGQASQGDQQATSLTTGQPEDPLTEHAQFAQAQALFYVVQARAGKCAAPPDRMLVRDR